MSQQFERQCSELVEVVRPALRQDQEGYTLVAGQVMLKFDGRLRAQVDPPAFDFWCEY